MAWSLNLNPSAITKKTLIETKKLHIKMLKMALFNCANNEKCCTADRLLSICPLFSSPPPRGDLTAQESPAPRICHPREKKIVPGGGGVGFLGARRSCNWSDLKYVSLTVLKRADITEKAVSPFQFLFLFLFSSFKEGGELALGLRRYTRKLIAHQQSADIIQPTYLFKCTYNSFLLHWMYLWLR